MVGIPAESGSYALWLNLSFPQRLQVGRLGTGLFPPGVYVYFGSARGPGGLRARLGRHLSGEGKPHWHIDVLRAVAEVKGYCYVTEEIVSSTSTPLECQWSQALGALSGTSVPLRGFGASDCRAGCPAHLIALPEDVRFELSDGGAMLAEALHLPVNAIICRRTK